MGKSKNGGTRSFLRGRVGADVYSIGKDGMGKKQQVVRSLAETVANPQTTAQMRGRMIMSTVMQAVSSLAILIDHSFDNVPVGQPNISEFVRRNYALIKADVAAHPASDNVFGIVKYGEKGAKQGKYVVAAGSQILPSAIANAAAGCAITVAGESLTLGNLKSTLGLIEDEYITILGLSADGVLEFTRIHPSTTLADTTVITASNASEALGLESVGTPTVNVAGQVITIALANAQTNSAVIISKKVNGTFKHNDAELLAPSAPAYTADVALATYPQGEEMILNGGNFNGGGGSTPVTPTYNPVITGVTLDGNAVTEGAAGVVLTNGSTLIMSVSGLDPEKTYEMQASTSDQAVGPNDPPATVQKTVSGSSVSQVIDTSVINTALYWMLVEVGSETATKIKTWFQSAAPTQGGNEPPAGGDDNVIPGEG